jgi:segregation and condensation protein B
MSTTAPPLELLIESLLFVADAPVTPAQLAQVLEVDLDCVEAAILRLEAACATRGIRLQRHAGALQFVTAPEAALAVERLLGVTPRETRLSSAALDVLAVVAYRQPITRARIEAVRGVDSGSALRALLGRGLIAEIGRADSIGRPILYATTAEFLRQFGLADLEALPPLDVAPTLST